jgi:hypothetical protein
VGTTGEEEEKTNTVVRGRDQDTEDLRDGETGNRDNETDKSAADSRTRAALFPQTEGAAQLARPALFYLHRGRAWL